MAEVSIFLDLNCADITKNWLLCSLDDDKLTGVTLKNIETLYNGILYGKYGNWSANEVCVHFEIFLDREENCHFILCLQYFVGELSVTH